MSKKAYEIDEVLVQFKESENESKVVFNKNSLADIKGKTQNQKKALNFYDKGFNLLLHGAPGTGKTLLMFFKAMEDILSDNTPYKKLVIVRSAVATRDIGFVPGTEAEKLSVYERPYSAIADEVMKEGVRNYDKLKDQGLVEFMSTSFIRGITFKNTIILVDEVENLNYHEIKSTITRVGEDTKIMFCGDLEQTDLNKSSGHNSSGLAKLKRVLGLMENRFRIVEFTTDDIVRDDLVKDFIIADIKITLTDSEGKIVKDRGITPN